MPDSGKYPHDKQVADPFAGTCAVAAKWNIDVGLKPLSKCNMQRRQNSVMLVER